MRAGPRIRVHPLHAPDRPVPLPRALLRLRLHTGRLPPAAVREEPDSEAQHWPGERPAQEGPRDSARPQHCGLWCLKESPLSRGH